MTYITYWATVSVQEKNSKKDGGRGSQANKITGERYRYDTKVVKQMINAMDGRRKKHLNCWVDRPTRLSQLKRQCCSEVASSAEAGSSPVSRRIWCCHVLDWLPRGCDTIRLTSDRLRRAPAGNERKHWLTDCLSVFSWHAHSRDVVDERVQTDLVRDEGMKPAWTHPQTGTTYIVQSSSSTNFIATQVLKQNFRAAMCHTYYTTAVMSMLLWPIVCIAIWSEEQFRFQCTLECPQRRQRRDRRRQRIPNHLPPPSSASQNYHLRPRIHNRQLPDHSHHLTDCNFFTCLLYKDIY